ncbi:MAG: YdcF family protein [Catalinimonas sp.]
MPLTWIVGLLLWAWLTKHSRRRRGLVGLSLVVAVVFGNPVLLNEAWRGWEVPPVPYDSLGTYDVAIVLGGVTRGQQSPTDRVHFGQGADRVLHAVDLYQRGQARQILLCGGGRTLLGRSLDEAGQMQRVVRSFGIPPEDIATESRSVNTRENALYAAESLAARPPGGKYLLVTSAFHQRRSLACFRKVGIEATPFSVDMRYAPMELTPDKLLIPSAEAMAGWSLLIHEIVGLITYKAIGYA